VVTAPAATVKVEQTVIKAEEVSEDHEDVMLNFFMRPTTAVNSQELTRYKSSNSSMEQFAQSCGFYCYY